MSRRFAEGVVGDRVGGHGGEVEHPFDEFFWADIVEEDGDV